MYGNRDFRDQRRDQQERQKLQIEKLGKYISGNLEVNLNEIFSKDGMLAKTMNEIPSHQLRKFYSELISISDTLSIDMSKKYLDPNELKKLQIRLAMLEPLAYYTKSRLGTQKYSEQFSELVNFITNSIAIINKNNDFYQWKSAFERFKQLFEVIIAYSKQEKGGRTNE